MKRECYAGGVFYGAMGMLVWVALIAIGVPVVFTACFFALFILFGDMLFGGPKRHVGKSLMDPRMSPNVIEHHAEIFTGELNDEEW